MPTQVWIDRNLHAAAVVEVVPKPPPPTSSGVTSWYWDLRVAPEEPGWPLFVKAPSIHHDQGEVTGKESTAWFEAFLAWDAWRTAQRERIALWDSSLPSDGGAVSQSHGKHWDAWLHLRSINGRYHWDITTWSPSAHHPPVWSASMRGSDLSLPVAWAAGADAFAHITDALRTWEDHLPGEEVPPSPAPTSSTPSLG